MRLTEALMQAGVVVFGTATVSLFGSKSARIKRYGYLTALCAEPMWFIPAFVSGQYGICIMCLIYTCGWIRGIKNNWGAV